MEDAIESKVQTVRWGPNVQSDALAEDDTSGAVDENVPLSPFDPTAEVTTDPLAVQRSDHFVSGLVELEVFDGMEEKHEATLQRIMKITQPSMTESVDPETGAATADKHHNSVLKRLQQRDHSLFLSSRTHATRSYLPAALQRQPPPDDHDGDAGQRRDSHNFEGARSVKQMRENQRMLEKVFSTTKHRFSAEERLETRFLQQRCRLAMLNKANMYRERHTALHNACVDMLEHGCHMAHVQLYDILRNDDQLKQQIADPRPGSASATNLAMLKEGMMEIEESSRRSDYVYAYRAANHLAMHFLSVGDRLWLCLQFFLQSLQISQNIDSDERMRQSEAHCNVAICKYFLGELEAAQDHVEQFRRLAYRRRWEIPDSYLYYSYACLLEQGVYRRLAQQQCNHEAAYRLYLKAAVMAEQAQNTGAQAQAQCDLGDILCSMLDWSEALKRYEKYLRLSEKLLDFRGSCHALVKLARCHIKLDNVSKAIDQLKRCEYIGSGQRLYSEVVHACAELGYIHLNRNDAEFALRYFLRAYEHVRLSGRGVDLALQDRICSMVGDALGNIAVPTHVECVYRAAGPHVDSLVRWKNVREPVVVVRK